MPPASSLDLETIYRDYHQRVYNYIYGQILHREAAEDLAADVFVAVAAHPGHFDTAHGNLAAWVFTIARNLTQNYRTRASTRLEECRGTLPDTFPAAPTAADGSLRSPDNIRAERILAKLSNDEIRFLELRYVLGLSNEQVGVVTGANAAAVSQKYCRLLAKCRKIDKEAFRDAP